MSDDLFDVFVEEADDEQINAYTLPNKLSSNEPHLASKVSQKRELSETDDTQSDSKRFEAEDFEDWR